MARAETRTALDVLVSIEGLLRQLVKQSSASTADAVASDQDLLGKYGDPELRFNPRDWTGPSYKGRRFSDCPPDLLDLVAASLEWFAEKSEEADERTDKGKPVAAFKRADAARARGWAKRIREGKHRPAGPPSTRDFVDAPTDDDIPFGWLLPLALPALSLLGVFA